MAFEFYIQPNQPFNFTENLKFLARGFSDGLQVIHGKCLSKCLKIGEESVCFRIEENKGNLKVSILNAGYQVEKPVRNYITSWFDINRNLIDFYEMAKDDKILRSLTIKYEGLRLISLENLFEAFSWAIIGQQINLAFAYTVKKSLVEIYGEKTIHNKVKYRLFPIPETILSVPDEDLRKIKFSRQKVSYIKNVAQYLITDKEKIKSLYLKTYKDLIDELTQIKGIGLWTAKYVAMRHFKKMEAFPESDIGLQNAIKDQLEMTRKPDLELIDKLQENWTRWNAYAALYLWRSLID